MSAQPITLPATVEPAPALAGLRLFRLVGDAYEPALRGGDMVMVSETDHFLYDATYLLDFGDGEAPYIVGRAASGFSIRHPNPLYSRHSLSRDEFTAAVTAIVVAEVRVRDEWLIRATAQRRDRKSVV